MRAPVAPERTGFLRQLHPAPKLLSCLILILAAVSLPPARALPRMAALGGALLVLWFAAQVPWRLLIQRLALALPFVLLAALSVPFMAQPGAPPLWHLGSLSVTAEGLLRLESVFGKALVCLIALSLLGATTSSEELLEAARALRIPALLVTVLSLTVRYLLILTEEARRMIRARDSRGVPRALRRRAAVAGAMVGALFLRSAERAERVGHAMVARGFDGTLPVLSRHRWRAADAVALGLSLFAVITLMVW